MISPDLESQFRHDGVAVWRGYLSPDAIEMLRGEYRQISSSREALAAAGKFPAELEPMRHHRTVYLKDFSDGTAERLAEPIRALAAEYLGKPTEIHVNTFARTVGPDRKQYYLPFHQDQALLKKPLVNLWIALDAAGEHAPGLELATGAKVLLPTAERIENRSFQFAHIPDVEIESRPLTLVHPIFEPGDAVIFKGTTPHRTFVLDGMTRTRLSIELRLV